MVIASSSLPARTVRLVVGLWLFALGVVFTLRAELGISPWDVLADGVRLNTPLTFGQAIIAIGFVLVAVSFAAGVRPGPGTIANMILIGVFADLMLLTDVGSGLDDSALILRLIVLVVGIAIIGLGSALYIGAELGAGPRDSLMVTVARRFKLRVGVARAIIEGSALIAGVILGGDAGLGTALFALAIGPAVDIAFTLFRMDASGRRRREEVVEGA